jgi:hypothetical protein
MSDTTILAPARGPGRPPKAPEAVVPAVAPALKFVEVEVKRKIGLDYVENNEGEMVRWAGEIAAVALPGEIVKMTPAAAAKLLKVGAVVPTSHTFD